MIAATFGMKKVSTPSTTNNSNQADRLIQIMLASLTLKSKSATSY